MDVILSRAGISSDQQRALCLGAVKDEVQQTETKVSEALAALRRVLDVVKVARDVNKSTTPLALLAPEVVTPAAKMKVAGKEIAQLLHKLHTGLNSVGDDMESSTEEDQQLGPSEPAQTPIVKTERARISPAALPRTQPSFELPPAPRQESVGASSRSSQENSLGEFMAQQQREPSPKLAQNSFLKPRSFDGVSDQWSLSESEVSEAEDMNLWGRERKRQAVESENRYPGRAIVPKPSSRAYIAPQPSIPGAKKNAVTELEKRLKLLPPGEMHAVFKKMLATAVEVARLENVTDAELSIQNSVDSAREAIQLLIDRCRTLPDRGMDRFEDLRQALALVVRAVQMSEGKLEAAGLRDLLALILKLQEQFPASAVRNRWCRTALRNYITATYTKSPEESDADQSSLLSALREVRGWKHRDDYSVARFEELLTFVRAILDGSYDGWKPRHDPRLSELLGLMNIRVDAFGASAIQQGRKRGVERCLSEMSKSSFTLTMDLESIPPLDAKAIYTNANGGFHLPDEVEAAFKKILQMRNTEHFGHTATALFTFLITAVLTRDQSLLPLETLHRFNESVLALNDCDPHYDVSEMLKANQELEKILYLMRVIMYKRPEYEEVSTSTVNILLSFFPASCRPTFVYPNAAKLAESSSKPTPKLMGDTSMDEVLEETQSDPDA